jgi:hypothetical protein
METPEDHQKSKVRTSKLKKTKNSYWVYPTKFAGSTPNHKKNYWNIKSTNQNENFQIKKYVYYLKSIKEPKIRMGAT